MRSVILQSELVKGDEVKVKAEFWVILFVQYLKKF